MRLKPGHLPWKSCPLKHYGDPCPKCGGYKLAATGGTDMRVVDIVEDLPEAP